MASPAGGAAVSAARPSRPDRVVPSWSRPGGRAGERGGRRALGPARGHRWGAVLDAAARLPAVHRVRPGARLDQAGARARPASGAGPSSTRISATPTRCRCSALYGLGTGDVPYLDSRVEYPVLTGGFIALAAALARGYDRAAEARGAPARPRARAQLHPGDRSAAVGLRAAAHACRAGARRPPAVGRRDDRSLAGPARARLHQLGPVRRRPGDLRHARLGPAPAGARGPAARAPPSRRSSIRSCCWAPCSCSACGPGGCASGAARRSPRWSPGRRSTCPSPSWRRTTGPGSSCSAGRAGPTRSRCGTSRCTSAAAGCSTGRWPRARSPPSSTRVVTVALLALRRRRRLAGAGRPGAAAGGAGGVPAPGRVPAAQQGLEPAVLAVAAAAGGARPARGGGRCCCGRSRRRWSGS